MAETEQTILSQEEQSRRTLVEWSQDDINHLERPNKPQWYKGTTYTRLPNKTKVSELGMNAVAEGWLPPAPIIHPDTRVLAIGSCFARYFILWLAEHGFNKSMPTSPYNALLRFGSDFESIAVVAQQFRWAFNELNDDSMLWIDKNKDIFQASEERRELVRKTLLETDVLLVTLGLSEVWYDRVTGEPLWRAVTADQFDPERHELRIETMEQSLQWLETIEQLRKMHAPNLKIIFTVSPVRLAVTFRPISAFTGNSVSKAILRASLDEFLRNHSDQLHKNLFYFPSFEFVNDYFLDPFEHDDRHVSTTVAASIIRFFVKNYCAIEMIERSGQSLVGLDAGEHLEQFIQQSRIVSIEDRSGALLARISELESKVSELQKVCDERLAIITELDTAARERLDIINVLDAEVKRHHAIKK